MKVKNLFRVAFLCFVLIVFRSTYIKSEQFSGFLDENITFDPVFTDLPGSFDLSTASVSSFDNLPFFTPESARTVVDVRDSLSTEYIEQHSEEIPGLSPMENAVLQHLSFSKKISALSGFTISTREGIVHNPLKEKLLGSKYYLKLHADIKNISKITLIGERDPMEPRALDLFSASVEVMLDHDRIRLVLGDFRPGFGQGLLFSRYGRTFGNGTDIMLRDRMGVANTFYEESRYLRGGYISVKRKLFTTQAWISVRRLDATIDESGNAVTIKDTGYHDSGTNRGNLTEKINAARFVITPMKGMTCAVAGALSHYSPALSRKEGEAYYHDPEGSGISHVSFDGKFEQGQAAFFIEHVLMDGEENATIGGLNIVKQNIRSCVLFRRYSEGYWAPRAGGFSSFGETSNEKGVYSAIQAELPFRTRMIASMDLARMLYRKAAAPLPVSRKRLNIILHSRVRKSLATWLGFRSTDDTESGSRRWNCRIAVEKRISKMRWRSKLAWSESGGDGGAYLETALLSHFRKVRFDVITGVFDLPSYDSRFYRYEYNVPGRGYTRAVWGRGGVLIFVIGWGPFTGRYRYSDSDLMDLSKQFALQFDMIF